MTSRRRRKCRHCGQLFRPNPRNLRHQRYCSAKECRRASKAASQRRWLAKAENRDSPAQPVDIDEQSDVLSAPALQDLSRTQSLVLTGLIAHLTGAALQEDIAITSRRLQHLALDIVQGDPDGRETIALP